MMSAMAAGCSRDATRTETGNRDGNKNRVQAGVATGEEKAAKLFAWPQLLQLVN